MNIGDKLPEILGINTKGETVRSSDFAGRPLIVYFYPKDTTPGCTAEACSFRDGYQQLTDMGYTVIGISKDSPASHLKFIAKYDLNFILLSDESTKVLQEFGVWQKKKMAGREYMGIVRTTFITDANHVVTHIISKVDTKQAVAQLLGVIGQ